MNVLKIEPQSLNIDLQHANVHPQIELNDEG